MPYLLEVTFTPRVFREIVSRGFSIDIMDEPRN